MGASLLPPFHGVTVDAPPGRPNFRDSDRIRDFHCNLLPLAQAGAILLQSRNISLRDGTVGCTGTLLGCGSSTIDGVLNAAGTSLDHFIAKGLSGYLVRSSRRPATLSTVDAQGMNGRIAAGFHVPLGTRWHDALLRTKPNLRILYTTVITRYLFRPRAYALPGFPIPAVVSVLLLWWRRASAAKHLRGA